LEYWSDHIHAFDKEKPIPRNYKQLDKKVNIRNKIYFLRAFFLECFPRSYRFLKKSFNSWCRWKVNSKIAIEPWMDCQILIFQRVITKGSPRINVPKYVQFFLSIKIFKNNNFFIKWAQSIERWDEIIYESIQIAW
jgi:hypothetical protein